MNKMMKISFNKRIADSPANLKLVQEYHPTWALQHLISVYDEFSTAFEAQGPSAAFGVLFERQQSFPAAEYAFELIDERTAGYIFENFLMFTWYAKKHGYSAEEAFESLSENRGWEILSAYGRGFGSFDPRSNATALERHMEQLRNRWVSRMPYPIL